MFGRADGEATEGSLKVYRWNLQGGGHNGSVATPVLSVGVNGENAVEMVSTTSTGFVTPGGASIGMSLNAFKEEVRTPYRGYKDSAGVRHLRFDTAGVAVTYDIRAAGATTVKSVTVFKPAATMPGPPPAIVPGVGVGPASGRGEILVFVLPEKDAFGDNAWVTVWVRPPAGAVLITTDVVTHQTAQGSAPGIGILELQAEFGVSFRTAGLAIFKP